MLAIHETPPFVAACDRNQSRCLNRINSRLALLASQSNPRNKSETPLYMAVRTSTCNSKAPLTRHVILWVSLQNGKFSVPLKPTTYVVGITKPQRMFSAQEIVAMPENMQFKIGIRCDVKENTKRLDRRCLDGRVEEMKE